MAKREPSAILIEGDIAYVALTKGFEAIVDTADLPIIQGHKWCCLMTPTGHAYAYRSARSRQVFMHREILGTPKEMHVDHEDGDGLNNRRLNIRNCTRSQNMANRVVERRNKLQIKGVSTANKRFRATISPGGSGINLGTYDTAAEAAAAYKGAAKILWGDFAKKWAIIPFTHTAVVDRATSRPFLGGSKRTYVICRVSDIR